MKTRIFEIFIQSIQRLVLPFAFAASLASFLGFILFSRGWAPLSLIMGICASLIGAFVAYVMAETWRLASTRRTVFISYTHLDSDFVKQLVGDLKKMNLEPLVDRLELKVGDDIRQAVDEMIEKSDYFLFVISESSTKSDQAMKELDKAMSRKKKLLPVLLQNASIPQQLSGVFYADFSGEYETGIMQLQKTFRAR